MYCQHCGAEAPQDLNYCKRCGGNLNPMTNLSAQTVARQGVSPFAIAAIGLSTFGMVVGGLLVLFGMLYNMSDGPHGVRGAAIVWLGLFGALTILGSVALLMRLAMVLLGGRTETEAPAAPAALPARRPAANELGASRVSALPDAVPSSVTEHTTRTFESSYREPRAR